MSEKDVVLHFAKYHIDDLRQQLELSHDLRLYALEFPVEYDKDKGYADIVLELENGNSPYDNFLFIIEAKIGKITHSALDQVNFYIDYIRKRLYRKKAYGMLLAPEYSKYTLSQAEKMDIACIQYDKRSNIRLLL